jgi:hypothetical protein
MTTDSTIAPSRLSLQPPRAPSFVVPRKNAVPVQECLRRELLVKVVAGVCGFLAVALLVLIIVIFTRSKGSFLFL